MRSCNPGGYTRRPSRVPPNWIPAYAGPVATVDGGGHHRGVRCAVNDPSDDRASSPADGPTVSVLNELTDAVFKIIYLIIKDDHDAVNAVFHRVNDRHGPAGMARVCIGLSAMILWLTDLNREAGDILDQLDRDPMATVNELFHSVVPG